MKLRGRRVNRRPRTVSRMARQAVAVIARAVGGDTVKRPAADYAPSPSTALISSRCAGVRSPSTQWTVPVSTVIVYGSRRGTGRGWGRRGKGVEGQGVEVARVGVVGGVQGGVPGATCEAA